MPRNILIFLIFKMKSDIIFGILIFVAVFHGNNGKPFFFTFFFHLKCSKMQRIFELNLKLNFDRLRAIIFVTCFRKLETFYFHFCHKQNPKNFSASNWVFVFTFRIRFIWNPLINHVSFLNYFVKFICRIIIQVG